MSSSSGSLFFLPAKPVALNDAGGTNEKGLPSYQLGRPLVGICSGSYPWSTSRAWAVSGFGPRPVVRLTSVYARTAALAIFVAGNVVAGMCCMRVMTISYAAARRYVKSCCWKRASDSN